MAWVSANCDVVKEKLMKEIEKVIDKWVKRDLGTMPELVKNPGIFSKIIVKYIKLKQKLRGLK